MISPIVVETWEAPPAPAELLARLPQRPHRFLLESQGGPADIARYSFLGQAPFLLFESHGRKLTVREADTLRHEADTLRQWEGDPLEALDVLLTRYHVSPDSAL